ncbi:MULTISPECIES: hypothetical protein [Proteus]|uniref:Uncharacterized protein n=1 Tax=Proteus columbae TaxID=1987580 RepID=A0A6I7D2J5_9GAMM|nr:hypothetical protein [Proteus columbae]MBG2800975.1 hypothetical protein [Proteus mirabilis]MBG3019718.1 hypothetical protein [Proteus mirabilis]MBG3151366.1 hypothetical protein [Proteus mirabilis]QHN11261.1 hypothetical protein F1325_12655 [Proteus columbae]
MFTTEELEQHTQLLTQLITDANQAVTDENLEYLVNFYTENGTLVVKDDLHISGKPSLKKHFSYLDPEELLAIKEYN